MKRFRKTAAVLFLVLTLCLPAGSVGVQASALSGDLVADFELNDLAYYNASDAEVYKVEAGTITCKVNILNNSAAAQELILISAVYDGEGNLETAGIDKQTVASKARKDFAATVTVDSATDRIIKAFVWDTANQEPYKEVASLTDKSSKKFDKAYFYFARTLESGNENPRRGYQGIVDEHKGTITFEIPYSRADAAHIKSIAQLQYAGFYFPGAENTTVTCDISDTFTPWVPLDNYKTKYNNLATGRLVYASEFSSSTQLNVTAQRPTFTFTAEDGSTASYKVNLFFVVMDDDFENTTTDSGTITSTSSKSFVDPNTGQSENFAEWEWAWTATTGDTTGFAGAEEDADGNRYLTVRRGSTTSTSRNQIVLKNGLRDLDTGSNANGVRIPLHNYVGTTDTNPGDADKDGYLDNVCVMAEYDWRYRGVTVDGTEYSDNTGNFLTFRNSSAKQLVLAEGVSGKTRKWNHSTVETATYEPDIWYHDRVVLGLDNSYYLTTQNGACRIYADDFHLKGQTAWDTDLTGQTAEGNTTLILADVRLSTSNTAGRLAAMDLDNLKIGLLYE